MMTRARGVATSTEGELPDTPEEPACGAGVPFDLAQGRLSTTLVHAGRVVKLRSG